MATTQDTPSKFAEKRFANTSSANCSRCVEAFLKLGLDRKVSILDLAAGTGLLGAEVSLSLIDRNWLIIATDTGAQVASHGYECVDGLDASLGMLGQAITMNLNPQCIIIA